MTSDERITVREIVALLGDIRSEMGDRFDKVETRLGRLELHRAADEAVEAERAKVRGTYRWLVSLALATAGSLALGILNLMFAR